MVALINNAGGDCPHLLLNGRERQNGGSVSSFRNSGTDSRDPASPYWGLVRRGDVWHGECTQRNGYKVLHTAPYGIAAVLWHVAGIYPKENQTQREK